VELTLFPTAHQPISDLGDDILLVFPQKHFFRVTTFECDENSGGGLLFLFLELPENLLNLLLVCSKPFLLQFPELFIVLLSSFFSDTELWSYSSLFDPSCEFIYQLVVLLV
jgi:hypothetical protein